MARKKPARPAARRTKKKAAPVSKAGQRARKAARKAVKSARKAAGKATRRAMKSARKATKPLRKLAAKAKSRVKKAGKAPAAKRATKAVRKAVVTAKAVRAGVQAAVAAVKKPNLDRPRKTVADIHGVPSSWGATRGPSAAGTGRVEMQEKLYKNTSVSPALTAGDVDADWQSAESSGDEAPGGDNPTPDQDVVDEIGRALGVEYADDEELQGGDEIAERDRHRWELDPHSADEFDDKD